MTALARELHVSYAFIERNFNLTKRYWGWELVWLAYSIANSLAVTFIGAGVEEISGQSVDSKFLILYLLIGTLVWHYLSLIFEIVSETIAWERWEGTIEYTLMAPISRSTHLVGATLFSLVYGFLHTVIILLVVTFFFNLDLSGANLVGAVMPLLFPERGAQMVHVIQAILLLVSGVYYPVSVMPAGLQALSHVSPATYVLQGMRSAILDGAPLRDLGGTILPLLALGVVMLPVGVKVFSMAERYAKRKGRLKRSG